LSIGSFSTLMATLGLPLVLVLALALSTACGDELLDAIGGVWDMERVTRFSPLSSVGVPVRVRPGTGLGVALAFRSLLPPLGTGLGLGLGISGLASTSSASSVSVSCWRTDLVALAGVRAVLFTEEGVIGSGVSPRAKEARLVLVGVLTSTVDELRRVRRAARGEAVPMEAENQSLRGGSPNISRQ